ncbi:MAG: AraC family transcriptional regulator [Bacteroidota bacterium]
MQAASNSSFNTPPSNAKFDGIRYRLLSLAELANSNVKRDELVLRYIHRGALRCRLHHYHFSLTQGQYLLANPGQQFLLTQNADQAEVLEIQIPISALKNALAPSEPASGQDGLVDFLDRKGQISFCEGSYASHDDTLGQLMIEIANQLALPGVPQSQLNQKAALAHALLETQSEIFEKINRLTSAKLSTKKELYRRLLQAQEYIHENLHTNLDLDTLSQVACLSKFHFIRLFKEVFEQTPRQYLIACRLERASKLLLNSSKSFHEICLDVGLKDSSSFGRLFKKNFGATPHIYRRIYAQAS